MAKGYADGETTQSVSNTLWCGLPPSCRDHLGRAMARKEVKDIDSPCRQLALPVLDAIFVIVMVCIVIPFSEEVRACTPCFHALLLVQVLCQLASSPIFLGCALRSVEHNVTGPGQKEDNQSRHQSCSLFPISL